MSIFESPKSPNETGRRGSEDPGVEEVDESAEIDVALITSVVDGRTSTSEEKSFAASSKSNCDGGGGARTETAGTIAASTAPPTANSRHE
ncbi:MAG: hypothetical protein ACKOA2_00835, partial [Ilumatobacteraceae bacterium]